MALTIHEAQDRPARERVYAFRYEQLANQSAYGNLSFDHKRAQIHDVSDDTAVVYSVEDGGRMVGTVRINFSEYGALPMTLRARFDTQAIENVLDGDRVSITSLLVVDPNADRAKIIALLFASVYHACLARQLLVNFWECVGAERDTFCRLGYRIFGEEDAHPDGLQALVLCVQDFEYLRRIESPLSWLAGRTEGDGGETAFLLGTLYGGFVEATAHFLSRRLREIRKNEALQLNSAEDLTGQCLFA